MSEAFVMEPANGTLTIGSSGECICQVIAGMVTSDQSENVVEAMCNTVITYGNARWYLDIDYLQDWRAAGLSTYLWNNDGATVAFTFSPDVDLTPKMVGNVRVKCAAQFAGPARQPARDRVRLACTAKPTLIVDV
jgi:hypothetical protein